MADLETLLFDLDGTLTDPSEGIIRSIQATFESVGHEPPPAASSTRCIGPPLRDSLRELGAHPEEVDSLVEAYRRRYREAGMFENRVYPGVPELLSRLRSAGFQLYVITSKPKEFAEAILQHFDLMKFFSRIFGSDLDGRLSDKRELLAHARRIAGFSVASSALVGDRGLEISAARSHGIFAIGALGATEASASSKRRAPKRWPHRRASYWRHSPPRRCRGRQTAPFDRVLVPFSRRAPCAGVGGQRCLVQAAARPP